MGRPGRAFTLVELVVVIAVLAISALIIYPKIDSPHSDSARLLRSAKQLAGVANYAQDLAISTQLPHILHIDLEQQNYWVTVRLTQGSETRIKDGLNLGKKLAQGICFDQVEIGDKDKSSQGHASLVFGPEGEVTPAILTLIAPAGKTVRVIINESSVSAGPCEIQWVE